MNKARLARQKLNDFENNTKFQKWAKNAKVMNLTIKNGKDILYGVIETIESFNLKVSLTNFDDFLSVYFEGVSRSVLKAWIKERNLVRNIKVSYVEYLQNLLNEKGMDYLTKSEYMEEQA
jgi:hypothetical protein